MRGGQEEMNNCNKSAFFLTYTIWIIWEKHGEGSALERRTKTKKEKYKNALLYFLHVVLVVDVQRRKKLHKIWHDTSHNISSKSKYEIVI